MPEQVTRVAHTIDRTDGEISSVGDQAESGEESKHECSGYRKVESRSPKMRGGARRPQLVQSKPRQGGADSPTSPCARWSSGARPHGPRAPRSPRLRARGPARAQPASQARNRARPKPINRTWWIRFTAMNQPSEHSARHGPLACVCIPIAVAERSARSESMTSSVTPRAGFTTPLGFAPTAVSTGL